MKIRHMLCGAALVVATAVTTSQVISQSAGKNEPPPMSPDQMKAMQDMEAKWAAFSTPGENHKLLGLKVGKWQGEVKMWMDPHQPEPMTSHCTTEYKWIMGDRYLSNNTEGDFNGQPFLGKAWEGYDNLKKKFAWVWIDNMGTGFMYAEGTYDTASKTFTHTYQSPDVMAGKYVNGRSTEKWLDNDHFVGQMFGPGPDGKEFKMMEISYTRAK